VTVNLVALILALIPVQILNHQIVIVDVKNTVTVNMIVRMIVHVKNFTNPYHVDARNIQIVNNVMIPVDVKNFTNPYSVDVQNTNPVLNVQLLVVATKILLKFLLPTQFLLWVALLNLQLSLLFHLVYLTHQCQEVVLLKMLLLHYLRQQYLFMIQVLVHIHQCKNLM
jgi:hypothetical protein